MRFRILIVVAAVLILVFSMPVHSGETHNASLIIVGPGDPIYTYWGHIGIAMENKVTGENLFYDFGNFSFYSDNFYGDFAMGRMMYLGFVTPTDYFISYSLKEDRDLSIYPLSLGDEELEELDSILRWWVLPENREYLYDYFLNNCSTIIRDILNDVTRGELKRQTGSIPDLNFRHYARTGAYPSVFAELLLHYLLGSNIDRPITRWDKMFLPEAVAEIARTLEYTDRTGEERVLAGEKTVLKKSSRPPVPEEPRVLWPWMLLAGTAAGVLWRLSAGGSTKVSTRSGTVYRVLIILLTGSAGAVLLFLMVFTDHASAYRNINLWPVLPTVLAALIPVLSGRRNDTGIRRRREIRISWIWTINLAGLFLSMILRISGDYPQNAGAFWAFFGPITLAASRIGLIAEDYLRRLRKGE